MSAAKLVSNTDLMGVALGKRRPYAWAGRVDTYLNSPSGKVLSSMEQHLAGLLGFRAAATQTDAWEEEERLTRAALRDLAVADPRSLDWGIAFEYELHLEGGRRPDVVVHTGQKIFVLEFKQASSPPVGAEDQVIAYARDLAEYHQASHGVPVEPVLILTRSPGPRSTGPTDVQIIAPVQLAALLSAASSGEPAALDFDGWLDSPYEPLPTLIEAARMIFQEEPLPRIRRAESAGIPEAVELLARLGKEAQRDSMRLLAFLAGVPGSGKTLTGLQLVYDRLADDQDAVFLSGNGPLVQVLRDALKSKTFVQDLHAFVTTYGTSTRTPTHHIVVFDEAQRAWDRGYMRFKSRGDLSEPEVLIAVGERLPGWCSLIGLVGDGQEIHSGEEAGLGQWNEAFDTQSTTRWHVAVPPRLEKQFPGHSTRAFQELDLTVSLRSRRAEDLHAWVASLLDGNLADAARLATRIQDSGFPMYVTRGLDAAKQYVVARYAGEPERRYGVLASSRSQRFLPEFGVPSDFPSTKKVNFAHWFNRPRGESRSGCNLDEVVTEFGCQGLELDLPLVAWGDDVVWTGTSWRVKPGRPQYPQDNPIQLRLNCYRVLLTRGRDGLVVFVPPSPSMDPTEHALLAAGIKPLVNDGPIQDVLTPSSREV